MTGRRFIDVRRTGDGTLVFRERGEEIARAPEVEGESLQEAVEMMFPGRKVTWSEHTNSRGALFTLERQSPMA